MVIDARVGEDRGIAKQTAAGEDVKGILRAGLLGVVGPDRGERRRAVITHANHHAAVVIDLHGRAKREFAVLRSRADFAEVARVASDKQRFAQTRDRRHGHIPLLVHRDLVIDAGDVLNTGAGHKGLAGIAHGGRDRTQRVGEGGRRVERRRGRWQRPV